MKFEFWFYLVFVVILLLTFWIGWYAIIFIVVLSIVASILLYIGEKTNKKSVSTKLSISDLFAGIAGLALFGTIAVAICMMLKGCLSISGPSYDTIERRTKIHTSEGDKMPTMSDQGEYHNAGTGERQIEYGGSREQEQDIKAADRLIENGY